MTTSVFFAMPHEFQMILGCFAGLLVGVPLLILILIGLGR